MKRQFIIEKYEDFTEEEKILYLQEGYDGVHNQIKDEKGNLTDFDLYIFIHDKDFYNKYKLLFVEEKNLIERYILKKMLEQTKWYIDESAISAMVIYDTTK